MARGCDRAAISRSARDLLGRSHGCFPGDGCVVCACSARSRPGRCIPRCCRRRHSRVRVSHFCSLAHRGGALEVLTTRPLASLQLEQGAASRLNRAGSRAATWSASLELLRRYPLTGVGIGNFGAAAVMVDPTLLADTGSLGVPWGLMGEFGLAGAVLFALFVYRYVSVLGRPIVITPRCARVGRVPRRIRWNGCPAVIRLAGRGLIPRSVSSFLSVQLES